MACVTGYRRVPEPPARMMPFCVVTFLLLVKTDSGFVKTDSGFDPADHPGMTRSAGHSGAARSAEPGIGFCQACQSSLADLWPQVPPVRIRFLDQRNFPRSPPLFQFLLALDRFDHRSK